MLLCMDQTRPETNTKNQNDVPRGIVLSIYLGCTEFSAADSICRTAPPSSVQVPLITAPRDAPLYHSAQLPLMLTGKAVRSNNASAGKAC